MLSSIFKFSMLAFAVSTYKSLPLAYYFRIYWCFGKNLIIAKYVKSLQYRPKSVFEISEFNTYNSPMECDFYLHKSNSCYFEELDIARSHLMTTIFQKFFHDYKTESGSYAFVPVGNIFGSFKREIKPFQKYSIKSRVLAWDNKWLFILSKFVIGKDKVASTMVTKYVLKDGRKTINPEQAIKFQGMWSEELELKNKENLKLCQWMVNTDQLDEFQL
jgi:acyl-CoA thioesterase FadM